jgi:hypothetical protein
MKNASYGKVVQDLKITVHQPQYLVLRTQEYVVLQSKYLLLARHWPFEAIWRLGVWSYS